MERENINLYLDACWRMGVDKTDIFITSDLHGRRNLNAVVNNLVALSRIAVKFGVKVKALGPNAVSLGNKVQFPFFELLISRNLPSGM